MADKGHRCTAAKTQLRAQIPHLIQELMSSLLKFSALRVGQIWLSKSRMILVSQECGLNQNKPNTPPLWSLCVCVAGGEEGMSHVSSCKDINSLVIPQSFISKFHHIGD